MYLQKVDLLLLLDNQSTLFNDLDRCRFIHNPIVLVVFFIGNDFFFLIFFAQISLAEVAEVFLTDIVELGLLRNVASVLNLLLLIVRF